MRTIVVTLMAILGHAAIAQSPTGIAENLQKKYKDSEAAILSSSISVELTKDVKASSKATITKTEKLLSLRYNTDILRFEHYDRNSVVEKFYGESSLKQRAPESAKFCGNYTVDGLFHDDSEFCSHRLKLKEIGEVWTMTSVKKINDLRYLTSLFFSERQPVQEKKISLLIPHEMDVEIREFNFQGFAISKTQKTQPNGKVIEYVAKDLAPVKSYPNDRGAQFSEPHILVMVKSVMADGKKVNLISSTDELYRWYFSLVRQLKPDQSLLKPMVSTLTAGKPTDEEKIKAIYYWVQDNIRYIAFEDGIAAFKPDEAHAVFEKRYGDCKGMANLLKEMLKVAGYDARLTWIGTRRIMYDHTVPSIAINNHMICTVILNEKKYYLDATEKYMPFGQNALRILDRPVMIENGDKFIAEKVAEDITNRDADVRTITASIEESGLHGRYSINLKGEAKKNFLYQYHYTKQDRKDEFMKEFVGYGNKKVKPSNMVLPDLNQREGPLEIECEYIVDDAVSNFDKAYYVQLDPAQTFNNFLIKDDRNVDIDFGERINRRTLIEFHIPKGYRVAHLPQSLDIPGDNFSFKITYEQKGDKIIYNKELKISEGVLARSQFNKWNDAVKALSKSYDEQIVLQPK